MSPIGGSSGGNGSIAAYSVSSRSTGRAAIARTVRVFARTVNHSASCVAKSAGEVNVLFIEADSLFHGVCLDFRVLDLDGDPPAKSLLVRQRHRHIHPTAGIPVGPLQVNLIAEGGELLEQCQLGLQVMETLVFRGRAVRA